MQELSIGVRAAILTLFLFQIIVVTTRLPGNRKAEVIGFAAVLLAAGLRAVAPDAPSIWRDLPAYLLLYAGGSYLGLVTADERRSLWNLALAVLGLALLLIVLLGFHGTAPLAGLLFFGGALAAWYPVNLLIRLWKSTRSAVSLYFTGVAVLGIAATGYDILAGVGGGLLPRLRSTLWISLLILGGTGYLLAVEGYLQSAPWSGLARRLGQQEQKIRSARSRLIQTENLLLLQDRLIDAGLLAAGAAHEFKNSLSTIAMLADHGLSRTEAGSWRSSLQAVSDSVAIARRTAMELLERLVPQGQAAAQAVHLPADLGAILRLVRAACRPDGIRIELEIGENLAVFCRREDLEQVLLNLLRNALESLRRRPDLVERRIQLRAQRGEGGVVLDVADNGRGIPPELGGRIFEFSVSGESSTGLGLYLSRMLVQRNGGSLEALPVDTGSCFRLVLPSA